MFTKSHWKAVPLLIGGLALAITASTPAMANRHGIWWYRHNENFHLTLINLTDHTLIESGTVNSSDVCYPYPFEHHSIRLGPYKTAIWASDTSLPWPSAVQHYSGSMRFQVDGMGPEWAFDLKFLPEDANGSCCSGKGTWIYLMAADVTNSIETNPDYGWTPSWEQPPYGIYAWDYLGNPGYRGYATPLNDAGYLHNQMNLEGTDLAVTVYTADNITVTLVVQQIDRPAESYSKWKLDWVDNDANGVPEQ